MSCFHHWTTVIKEKQMSNPPFTFPSCQLINLLQKINFNKCNQSVKINPSLNPFKFQARSCKMRLKISVQYVLKTFNKKSVLRFCLVSTSSTQCVLMTGCWESNFVLFASTTSLRWTMMKTCKTLWNDIIKERLIIIK